MCTKDAHLRSIFYALQVKDTASPVPNLLKLKNSDMKISPNKKKETNKYKPVHHMAQAHTELLPSKGTHIPAKHNFDPAHSKLQFSLPCFQHPPYTECTHRLLTELDSAQGKASILPTCQDSRITRLGKDKPLEPWSMAQVLILNSSNWFPIIILLPSYKNSGCLRTGF
jgi:hypothetical protein